MDTVQNTFTLFPLSVSFPDSDRKFSYIPQREKKNKEYLVLITLLFNEEEGCQDFASHRMSLHNHMLLQPRSRLFG